MPKLVSIYGLTDESTGDVRYVGQTCYPVKWRVTNHLTHGLKRQPHTHLYRWIRSIISSGGSVGYVVLEENAERNLAEIGWIEKLKKEGASLVNGSKGGDGFGEPRTKEHALKISIALKGKPKSKEHKERLSLSLVGRPLDAHRAKLLAIARRLPRNRSPVSKDTALKISVANRGKIRSPEAKLKYSIAKKKWWDDRRQQNAV